MPHLLVTKSLEFSSSHFLTDYEGQCENLHGHNYRLEVTVMGEVQANGLVIDFLDLKKTVKDRVISRLDHVHLNDLFDNPTAENIIVWIWEQLEHDLNLYELKLWETSTSYVTYKGPASRDFAH